MNEMIVVSESDNGREVGLRLRQSLRITLPEIRTAGFRWNLHEHDERVLTLVDESTEPPAGGAGGSLAHHWDFRANESGVATIALGYSRTWERATTAARSFSITVRVA
jgi:predicted secreted protein